MKDVDSIEKNDVLFRQVPKRLDVGDSKADADESGLSRARRAVEVHDRAARNQEAPIDAWLPQNDVAAAHRTAFSGTAVQAGPEEVGRHLPFRGRRRSDKLVDRGEALRDFFGRKAFAQPPTSDD